MLSCDLEGVSIGHRGMCALHVGMACLSLGMEDLPVLQERPVVRGGCLQPQGVYSSRGVFALAAKVQSMLLSGHSLLLVSGVVAVKCMQPGTSNSLQKLLAIQTCMPCCFRHLTRQSSTACICTAAALMRRVFKHLFALSCIVQDCSERQTNRYCCCQAWRQCTSCGCHSWFVKGWYVAFLVCLL